MKIAVVSAVWGRIPLMRVWWTAYQRMASQLGSMGHVLQAYIAGSEEAHHKLCRQHGGEWVEADNRYIGDKWNKATRAALADGAEAVLILGSDDFLSPDLVTLYGTLAGSHPFIGLVSMYMHEPTTDRTLYVDNRQFKVTLPGRLHEANGAPTIISLKRKSSKTLRGGVTTLGAGRLLSADLFAGHEYFWDPLRDRGLDASMERLLGLPAPRTFASADHAFALDVKTAENIWSFDKLLPTYHKGLMEDHGPLAALPEWDAIRALASTRRER